MKSIRGNGGSATILMILMASVIITVGLGFNWLVREHIRSSEGLKNKAEAILKARSAYDTMIYLLLNGQQTAKEVIIAGGTDMTALKTLPLNGRAVAISEDVRVQLQDTNGLLSLAVLRTGALERLIRKTEGLDNALDHVNSFLDWTDVDELTRLNGGEAFYYRGQGVPYAPGNRPLQYKEECGFIKGFDKGLYGKLQPYLTLLPATGFNPNTASDAVLMATLGIHEDAVNILKTFMAQQPIVKDSQLFALTGRTVTGESNFFPSPYLEVTVQAGAPKTIYRIKAGLNLIQNEHSPYGIVFWSEE